MMDSPDPDLPPPIPLKRVVRPTVIAPPPPRRATRVSPPQPRRVAKRRITSVTPLMITMGVFALMMATLFGQLVYAILTADLHGETQPDPNIRDTMITQTALVEVLDSTLVVVGLLIVGRPLVRSAVGTRLPTWAVALPGLLLLLAVNLGYHQALRWLVMQGADPDPNELPIPEIGFRDGWIAILLICVQPAVIEELFFRYMLYGHLRPHIGLHAAVWVSSVIFGMAHLGAIAGWPVLILLGAGLGYARVYSGGLALPILLHFLHNIAVLGIDHLMHG